MTNTEIIDEILRIRAIKNACDRTIELKQFEKKYKKTKFYKQTRKPLQTLYYEVLVEDTLSLRVIMQSVKEFIDSLDSDKIIAMFDEVNAKTRQTMEESLASLDSSNLMDLLHSVKR